MSRSREKGTRPPVVSDAEVCPVYVAIEPDPAPSPGPHDWEAQLQPDDEVGAYGIWVCRYCGGRKP